MYAIGFGSACWDPEAASDATQGSTAIARSDSAMPPNSSHPYPVGIVVPGMYSGRLHSIDSPADSAPPPTGPTNPGIPPPAGPPNEGVCFVPQLQSPPFPPHPQEVMPGIVKPQQPIVLLGLS